MARRLSPAEACCAALHVAQALPASAGMAAETDALARAAA
jgi:hypothetical protein